MAIGNLKASMPRKCMDQMPIPMAAEPPKSHNFMARSLLSETRLDISRAV